jgi:hypothetical protein
MELSYFQESIYDHFCNAAFIYVASVVLAWLGPKAPALAWPKGAPALKNLGPGHEPLLGPGSGLAWPRLRLQVHEPTQVAPPLHISKAGPPMHTATHSCCMHPHTLESPNVEWPPCHFPTTTNTHENTGCGGSRASWHALTFLACPK